MADDAQSAADSSAYQQVGTRNPVGCAILPKNRRTMSRSGERLGVPFGPHKGQERQDRLDRS